jgi:hypothetical protein
LYAIKSGISFKEEFSIVACSLMTSTANSSLVCRLKSASDNGMLMPHLMRMSDARQTVLHAHFI